MSIIQLKRGTATALTSLNPVLAAGEMVWESDSNYCKIGDGVNTWSALPYQQELGLEAYITVLQLDSVLDGYVPTGGEEVDGYLILDLPSAVPAAADSLVISDYSDSHALKKVSLTDFGKLISGDGASGTSMWDSPFGFKVYEQDFLQHAESTNLADVSTATSNITSTATLADYVDGYHIGLFGIHTSTSSTGSERLNLASSSTALTGTSATHGFAWEAVCRTPDSLSDGTDTYYLKIGCFNAYELTGFSAQGDHFFFLNGANWTFRQVNSGPTDEDFDTGVVATAGTWYHFRVERTASGNDTYVFVDGNLVASIVGSVRNSRIFPRAVIQKSLGTSRRDFIIDYFGYQRFRV